MAYKYIIDKYRETPLAMSVSDKREVFVDTFLNQEQFSNLIEYLEDGHHFLTQAGVDFIREYFGFETFLSLIDSSYKNHQRLASGIKWILQKRNPENGINLKKAKEFAIETKKIKSLIREFDAKILGLGQPPFRKRFPQKYQAEDFLDVVTFMFFIDKLDSAEAKLTENGLNFIREGYGWEKILKIFEFLHKSGFILRYKNPEDIVNWLKNLGEFPEKRESMLIRDGF